MADAEAKPVLLVLASTYPRWRGDHEPGFVHELSRRLGEGFNVIVLCPHAAGAARREWLDGVEVVRFPYAPARLQTLVNDGGIATNIRRAKWKMLLVPLFVMAQLVALVTMLVSRRVDAIHAHWLVPQGLIACVARSLTRSHAPILVTSHGADVFALRGKTFDVVRRHVLRRVQALTVVSRALLDRLSPQMPAEGLAEIIPMGVDLEETFTVSPTVERDPCLILFVGRLVEKKGVIHLIRAMPAIRRRHPDARLEIVGFGPEEPSLRAAVQRFGLEAIVCFMGPASPDSLPAAYRRAGVFVAPFVEAGSGDQEGLGLVVVEALGCGCPVVVGNVGAVADTLGLHFRDVAVNATDEDALADRIVSVLSAGPASQRALAASVRDRFDWRAIAGRYSELLARLIHDASLAER
ncbi:glycosyltransferase [Pseudoxanthomonas sp. Root630]|uniref:glycosyltransferase n=1 Tax=Pseudoxanthomonas sp. Root630 TaxID=1736574 RepID=UPI000703BD88|nr:glycosyltransferase [Pseudoxanthomonas sp. Root630]KRA51636.1 hypothetical protein ASD72_00615 [Pseudoxanthomonas sp. Root630]